jgi:hypothetical protein
MSSPIFLQVSETEFVNVKDVQRIKLKEETAIVFVRGEQAGRTVTTEYSGEWFKLLGRKVKPGTL